MTNKQKKPPKKYRSIGTIQQIDWVDHHSRPGWHDPSELFEECWATTYGRVINETEAYVHLAGTECQMDPSIGNTMSIVKACIKKRKVLK